MEKLLFILKNIRMFSIVFLPILIPLHGMQKKKESPRNLFSALESRRMGVRCPNALNMATFLLSEPPKVTINKEDGSITRSYSYCYVIRERFMPIYRDISSKIALRIIGEAEKKWGHVNKEGFDAFIKVLTLVLLEDEKILKALCDGELDLHSCEGSSRKDHRGPAFLAMAFAGCERFNKNDVNLFIGECILPIIIEEISQFATITKINLNDNYLSGITTPLLSVMKDVRELSCDFNQMVALPDFSSLKNLKNVSLKNNHINYFNGTLFFSMTRLPVSLSWINLSGNLKNVMNGQEQNSGLPYTANVKILESALFIRGVGLSY